MTKSRSLVLLAIFASSRLSASHFEHDESSEYRCDNDHFLQLAEKNDLLLERLGPQDFTALLRRAPSAATGWKARTPAERAILAAAEINYRQALSLEVLGQLRPIVLDEALYIATRAAHLDFVNDLLSLHAYDRAAIGNAIIHALYTGQREPLARLIKEPANFNFARSGSCVQGEPKTPLMVAASLGDLDSVILLLSHGADLQVANRFGKTAYDIAAQAGHESLASELYYRGVHDIVSTLTATAAKSLLISVIANCLLWTVWHYFYQNGLALVPPAGPQGAAGIFQAGPTSIPLAATRPDLAP